MIADAKIAACTVAQIRPRGGSNFSHVKNVDQLAAAMLTRQRRSVQALIELSMLCAHAQDQLKLSRSKLSELRSEARISQPSFSRMLRVGRHPCLTDASYWPFLPAAIGTLYELGHVPKAEFELAFAKGLIRPELEREQAASLRQTRPRKSRVAKTALLGTLHLKNATIPRNELKVIRGAVKRLLSCPSLTVKLSTAYDRLSKNA